MWLISHAEAMLLGLISAQIMAPGPIAVMGRQQQMISLLFCRAVDLPFVLIPMGASWVSNEM